MIVLLVIVGFVCYRRGWDHGRNEAGPQIYGPPGPQNYGLELGGVR